MYIIAYIVVFAKKIWFIYVINFAFWVWFVSYRRDTEDNSRRLFIKDLSGAIFQKFKGQTCLLGCFIMEMEAIRFSKRMQLCQSPRLMSKWTCVFKNRCENLKFCRSVSFPKHVTFLDLILLIKFSFLCDTWKSLRFHGPETVKPYIQTHAILLFLIICGLRRKL